MASMDDEELAEVADGLYAKPLDDFVSARAEAAKKAAAADKQLAAAIRKLPKPSVAAWAVNMLALHQPDVLAALAALGGQMREAQASLDARNMRELGRERRTMLTAAIDAARKVAREQGRPLSDWMATDVEETLRAMTADKGAAEAVRSGRLLKTLSADGVNAADLTGAVAVPGALPVPKAGPPPKRTAPAKQKTAEQKTMNSTPEVARQPEAGKPRLEAVRQVPRPASVPALEKAKAVLAEARELEAQTAQQAKDLQHEVDEMRSVIAETTQEITELRASLKAAEERLDRSRKRLSSLAAEAKQAGRAADKAERTAMLAKERVLRLGNTRS